jgi:hypothetical protein
MSNIKINNVFFILLVLISANVQAMRSAFVAWVCVRRVELRIAACWRTFFISFSMCLLSGCQNAGGRELLIDVAIGLAICLIVVSVAGLVALSSSARRERQLEIDEEDRRLEEQKSRLR